MAPPFRLPGQHFAAALGFLALGAPIRSETPGHAAFWLYVPGVLLLVSGLVLGRTLASVAGDAVRIVHTLTTPGCPMESHINRGIREAARSVEGVTDVETELVWEPRWHPEMIDDDAW